MSYYGGTYRISALCAQVARLEELLKSSREVCEKRRLDIVELTRALDDCIKDRDWFHGEIEKPCPSCGHVRKADYSPES